MLPLIARFLYLRGKLICAQLAKGLGHNSYGEPAWPNDSLYVFPIASLATIAFDVGFSTMVGLNPGAPANPFATPLEILPEWYFFPAFNLLLGVLVCFIENTTK